MEAPSDGSEGEPLPEIPQLTAPPIEEVVCGVVFAPVDELDALVQGVYWDSVSERFPRKQVQPILLDGGPAVVVQTAASIRSWLISEDDDFLLQVQQDRFYMNWRRRGGKYPRFRDHDHERGLCSRALEEFGRFQRFVKERCGVFPEPVRIELQKQDLLIRNTHWSDLSDLASIMPVISTFAQVQTSERVGLHLMMAEPYGEGRTTLQIATRTDSNHVPDAVRLDFQCSAALEDKSIEEAFRAANTRLNRVFARLFTAEAWPRFNQEGVDATR